MGKKFKGVLVKMVSPDYKMSDGEAKVIAELTERGYVVIFSKKYKRTNV